ncbi:MAG: LamG-like jellyroll fold domain-containing protein [Rariglobus sp.]
MWIATVNSAGAVSSYANIGAVMAANDYASAQVPTGYATTLYQVVVKDGSGVASSPVFINRARITSAEFPEIDANRQFRLFGRNLVMTGATPSVRFVDNTTLTSTAGTVISGGDRYVVKVQAPSTLVAGRTYTIYYRNGLGGSVGEVAAPDTLLARTGGTDSFALGMPWGADYSGFAANVYDVKTDSRLPVKAIGDGITDDKTAIQNAINAANAAGGGVVHLPAGTYRVATFGGTGGGVGLTMKSNVVLRGAGQTSTTLALVPPASVTTHTGMISLPAGSSVMGISEMTITSSTQVTVTGKRFPFITTDNDVTKFFALNVTFDGMNWALGGLRLNTPTSAGHLLVSGCTIKNLRRDAFAIMTKDFGSALNRTRNVYIRDCVFPNIMAGISTGGNYIIVENNTITYDGTYENTLTALGQTYVLGSRDRINVSGSHLVILNNTFSHVGAPWIYGNNSENILGEDLGASLFILGAATSGTSGTLGDTTQAWTADQFAGMDVVLLTGNGAGQVRKISTNSATTVTLSSPWDVSPVATDRYTITRMNVPHLLVKGNTMQDKRRMILLNQGAYDTAIVNNIGVNSGDINVRAVSSTVYPSAHCVIKTLIADNTVTATSYDKQSNILIGSAHWEDTRWGTISFVNEIRRNTVTAKGDEAFRAIVSDSDTRFINPSGDTYPQGMVGVIFDRNTAYDANTAYGWNKGIDGLTVSNAVTENTYRDTYDMVHADGLIFPGASMASDGTFTDDGTGYLDLAAMEIPTAVTIEGNFKTAANGPILSNRFLGGKLVLSITSGKLSIWDNGFPGSGVEATPATLNDNAWHQFAWTCDGSANQIFVDGVLVRSSTRTRVGSTGVAFFGRDPSGSATLFNGKLKEFRVWAGVQSNTALNTYRTTKLAGDEPGLLQYWRMDEGSGQFARNHVLDASLSEGLVGYWRLDEGSGTTAADSSGSGNTGTLVNSPSWVTGEIGYAASFNGGTSYLSVPDSASLVHTGSFTIHARVKIDSISTSGAANWRGIVCKGDPNLSTKLGWELGTFGGSGTMGFFLRRGTGGGTVTVYSGTGMTTGRFYTVDAVWDAATAKTSIYVDGVLHSTVSNAAAHAPSPGALLIGKRAAGSPFIGAIDDVKFFDRALSAREINELF